jgi:FtsP/CotA-like multicopper oxidase with cupredoxin domain
MATRREFIKWTAASGAGLVVGRGLLAGQARAASMAPTAPTASVAASLTPYLDTMPTLVDNAIDATSGGTVNISTGLVSRQVHKQLKPTTLFGYLQPNGPSADNTAASYIGPVIVAKSGTSVAVNYANGLAPGAFTNVFTNGGSSYTQFLPKTDQVVKILTHLHGGFVAGADDGNPFASSAFASGTTQSVTYPNEQPATLSWYHDHYLGDTRMNVVAGLAGGYLIRDAFDNGSNPLLPGPIGKYELPMVVQDRQFNTDGSLLYPVAPASTNGPWIGEYFGDVMLVNGKIWPALTVEPAVYRFRVLNGCNARILNLRISTANDSATVPMTIIGTEGGLLPVNPAGSNGLVMTSAERFDVICDFRGFAGQTLLMKNTNPPNSVVSTPAPSLTKVMQITVLPKASPGAPMTVPPAGSLPRNPAVEALTGLGPPALSGGSVSGRMITLNEITPKTPTWILNLNAHPYGDPNPVTETVKWKTVEDWYYVNTTPDTHPMHTHLFTFTVMGRYNLDIKGFVAANGTPNGVPQMPISTLTPFLKGGLIAPPPEETGLKETVKANPGQVTVIRAMFSLPTTALSGGTLVTPQKYVHHCHIVEHEDNDMMERVMVVP